MNKKNRINNPALQLITDGRKTKVLLYGKDISASTEEIIVNVKGLEVDVTLKLFSLHRSNPKNN